MNQPASQPYQLLPELMEDEFQALLESIAEHGVLVPVEYDEGGNILDGHHRVAACEKLGLCDWPKIIRSNLSETEKRTHVRVLNVARRQLSSQEKRALISAQIIDTPKISSRRIGGILGVCHKTVGRVRDNMVRRGTVPHVSELEDSRGRMQAAKRPAQYLPTASDTKLYLDGAKTIRDNKMRNKRAIRFERDRLICEAGRHVVGEMPRKAFSVIYADPPWEEKVYSNQTGKDKAPPYPTMPDNEIIELCAGQKSPAIENAVLFLWTTGNRVDIAIDVMRAWGFTFKTSWVWDKKHIGMGRWVRDRHEMILIGKRGDFPAPIMGEQFESLYQEIKGKHSAKPDFFANEIERLYPDLPKLELFRRGARPGWSAWGFEAVENE